MSFRAAARSGNVLRTGAVLASVAALGVASKSCGNESSPEVQISPGSTVEDIRPSHAIPLIEITGSAYAEAYEDVKVPGLVPFIGGDKVPATGKKSFAKVNGIVEFRTEEDSVDYDVYDLPKRNPADTAEQGIQINIDARRIYMRASMGILFKNGVPQTNEDHELFGVQTGEGVLKRGAIASKAAEIRFQTKCGKQVLSTLVGGAIIYTREDVNRTAAIPQKLPGGKAEADLMKRMASKDIKVVFTDGPEGPEIKPEDIPLRYQNTAVKGSPIVPLFDEKKAIDSIKNRSGDSKNVYVPPGPPCTFDRKAVDKLMELSKKNSVPNV